jgi:hypothetical protein
MKKIVVLLAVFFLAFCVFGQSPDMEIEKLKKAVIPYSGKILEDAFNIFATASSSTISYDMSFMQPDPPDDQFYKDMDITIQNKFGRVVFFYRIKLSSMEAFLNMVIINRRSFDFDMFGLPTDVLAFTEYYDWIYDSFGDIRLWF